MAENLKPRQEAALSELRQLVSDIPDATYKETHILLKFLIAREFNAKHAESMIRKNIQWKKEIQLDSILTDFKSPEVLQKYAISAFFGFDKEGYVVRYMPVGDIDGIGLSKSANSIYWVKHFLKTVLIDVQLYESQYKKLGRRLDKSVYIYDLDKLSFAQITHLQSVQYFLKFCMILQDNFPEMLKRLYIINASEYFTKIWFMFKKCLGSSLLNKIFIYGQNGWKEEFLRTMDADILPAFLGGNRTDPDGNPRCFTLVNHLPEPVPEKYFLEKNVQKMARKPGVKSDKIDRQSSVTEPIEITEPNSIINWEFELKKYDIGFGILLEVADGPLEELIPVHKIETEVESYIGMYRCKKPGKYLVVFDNCNSWFHSKEIYYRTWITNEEAT